MKRAKRWQRWSLRLLFFSFFGFAGGVMYLLFFLVPFEQWLVDREISQGTIDLILGALVVGWGVICLGATALYDFLFLWRRQDLPAGIGTASFVLALAFVTFYFLLDTDLMAAIGSVSEDTVEGERITAGAYPDAERVQGLKDEGYEGIITLLNPDIPFERVLLEEEIENGENVGIPVYSYPMLPWISENQSSLEEIKELTANNDEGRFYVHCYLGKHRVDYVRQELEKATGEVSAAAEQRPLRSKLERGRLVSYDEERIILGPYPTEGEWFSTVLRRDVEEVVSTLDPISPDDTPWIEEEKRIAEENGLIFTPMPLDPESPDPQDVGEVADYVAGREGKVYVHDFLEGERFGALETALEERATRDTTEETASVAGS